MQLLCIFDNIANVEVWNFWLNKVWILAMCKKKKSLQVGTLIFKFIETKSRKIYEGKYWLLSLCIMKLYGDALGSYQCAQISLTYMKRGLAHYQVMIISQYESKVGAHNTKTQIHVHIQIHIDWMIDAHTY